MKVAPCLFSLLAILPLLAEEAQDPQAEIQALICQLGDDAFPAREKAQARLLAIGAPALPALREALKGTKDPEVESRCQSLIVPIEREERLKALKDDPDLRKRVEKLLKANPGTCALVSRAVLVRPKELVKPLTNLSVSMNLMNLTDQAKGQSHYSASPDENGVFIILVPPGDYWKPNGGGYYNVGHLASGHFQRWELPKRFTAEANGFVLLPDLEYIEPIIRLTLCDGKHYRLADKPVLKWQRYLEAKRYRISIGRMTETPSYPNITWIPGAVEVQEDVTEVRLDQVVAEVEKAEKSRGGLIKEFTWSGRFIWHVTAFDEQGRVLSSDSGLDPSLVILAGGANPILSHAFLLDEK